MVYYISFLVHFSINNPGTKNPNWKTLGYDPDETVGKGASSKSCAPTAAAADGNGGSSSTNDDKAAADKFLRDKVLQCYYFCVIEMKVTAYAVLPFTIVLVPNILS